MVNRQFRAEGSDRLWAADITQHRTEECWVYAAVVLDVLSRRVVGCSIATICASSWSPMPWIWPG